MAAASETKRIVIVSADVAGGHDAAARSIASRLELGNYEVTTMNGLAACGSGFHHLVRDGYRLQLNWFAWSYRVMFGLALTRWFSWLLWMVLPVIYGRRMSRALASAQPDVVISTYPLCTAIIGGLRRSRKLTVPALAMVTDVDPHALWFAPGVDLHLLTTPGDVVRAERFIARETLAQVRPPVDPRFESERAADKVGEDNPFAHLAAVRESGREVVLLTGGAWGVGELDRLVGKLVDVPGRLLVVACGSNERLRADLASRYDAERLVALPYVDDMPALLAQVDLLVSTGAGMTVFEAVLAGVPVVMASAIEGHGERSARALHGDGIARYAHHGLELEHELRNAVAPPASILFEAPDIPEYVARLGMLREPAPQRARRPRRIRAASRLVVAGAAALTLTMPVVLLQAEERADLAHAATVTRHAASCKIRKVLHPHRSWHVSTTHC